MLQPTIAKMVFKQLINLQNQYTLHVAFMSFPALFLTACLLVLFQDISSRSTFFLAFLVKLSTIFKNNSYENRHF